jgi:hypothetical protein
MENPESIQPGDRIRRKGTELDPASSGLFERWDDEAGGRAVVHWDDQPFRVFDHVAVDELEIEPTVEDPGPS